MLVYLAIVVGVLRHLSHCSAKTYKWLFLALVLALSIMAFYMKPHGDRRYRQLF